MSEGARRWAAVPAILLALALVLGGQALGDGTATVESGAATGSAAGHAGFAYLTGLRLFVADLLWNRMDPLGDQYYGHGLYKFRFMLPNIRVITWLDPQFVDARSVLAQVYMDEGKYDQAIQLLQEGLKIAPGQTSFTQLLQQAEASATPTKK